MVRRPLFVGETVNERVGCAEAALASRMTPKRRSLHRGAQGELVLSYYPAGHHMAEHSHDLDQRSLILSGALAEETISRAARPVVNHMGFKAAGLRHENRYGPEGALILSLNGPPGSSQGLGWGWSPITAAMQFGALLSAVMGPVAPSDAEVTDMLALMSSPVGKPESEAPPWLIRVRDAVREDPDGADIQALADAAGVHRVHLSRAYSRHFHSPISLDRRRIRMARAVRALMEEGLSAADAACMAGFADQAHLARTLKAETALTPRALLRVFNDGGSTAAGVTSVQDHTATSPYRAA